LLKVDSETIPTLKYEKLDCTSNVCSYTSSSNFTLNVDTGKRIIINFKHSLLIFRWQ